MKSADELDYVYGEAKKLLVKREEDYQGSWREEGLICLVGSLYKKASQIRTMLENGRLRKNKTRSKEDLLDSINYAIFCYRLLDKEDE